VIYPNGQHREDGEHSRKSFLKGMREDPTAIKHFKVIDTDLPVDDPLRQIVGVSRWKIFPCPRSDEELEAAEKEAELGGRPPNAGPALEAFHQATKEAHAKILGGQPHLYLHILATHSRHLRRGVGALHLRWGLEHADKLGLPTYLESSPAGKPVYERKEFEVVEWLPFDAGEYGYHEELAHAVMIRPAKE
jgi:hypothetical protein